MALAPLSNSSVLAPLLKTGGILNKHSLLKKVIGLFCPLVTQSFRPPCLTDKAWTELKKVRCAESLQNWILAAIGLATIAGVFFAIVSGSSALGIGLSLVAAAGIYLTGIIIASVVKGMITAYCDHRRSMIGNEMKETFLKEFQNNPLEIGQLNHLRDNLEGLAILYANFGYKNILEIRGILTPLISLAHGSMEGIGLESVANMVGILQKQNTNNPVPLQQKEIDKLFEANTNFQTNLSEEAFAALQNKLSSFEEIVEDFIKTPPFSGNNVLKQLLSKIREIRQIEFLHGQFVSKRDHSVYGIKFDGMVWH